MAESFPRKKISAAVQSALKNNNFVFVRCRGHAIFRHEPSGRMYPVQISQKGGDGFFSGDKYIVAGIKKLLSEVGATFVE